MAKYYRTDEKENAVDFLQTAATFYTGSHAHKWKWLTISLHGALYGFAVLAIRGTDPDRVSKGKNKRLISLWEALDRCQDDTYMLQFSGSRRADVSDEERWAVRKLSEEFRNNFEHFMPKLWSIEVTGFPSIVSHVCRIIYFLAFESGNVRLTTRQRKTVTSAIGRLQRVLN